MQKGRGKKKREEGKKGKKKKKEEEETEKPKTGARPALSSCFALPFSVDY
jgi:hypothetical protein